MVAYGRVFSLQGHFCPNGSSIETPCAPGYHNPLIGVGAAGCSLCPAGSFQTDYAATDCNPCSVSSTSLAGSTSCTCLGTNRVYQPTDGACICGPGFEFVDENFNKLSEQDGVEPCQPIVYAYCVSGQTRSADGSCVSVTTAGSAIADCSASCAGGNGTTGGSGSIIPRTGLCQCNNYVPLEDVCNADCRATAPRVSIDPNGPPGSLVLTEVDPLTGVAVHTSINATDIPGFTGSLACSNGASGTAAGVAGSAADPTQSYCQAAMLQVRASVCVLVNCAR